MDLLLGFVSSLFLNIDIPRIVFWVPEILPLFKISNNCAFNAESALKFFSSPFGKGGQGGFEAFLNPPLPKGDLLQHPLGLRLRPQPLPEGGEFSDRHYIGFLLSSDHLLT